MPDFNVGDAVTHLNRGKNHIGTVQGFLNARVKVYWPSAPYEEETTHNPCYLRHFKNSESTVTEFNVGDRVRHKNHSGYGLGEVVNVTSSGNYAHVRWENVIGHKNHPTVYLIKESTVTEPKDEPADTLAYIRGKKTAAEKRKNDAERRIQDLQRVLETNIKLIEAYDTQIKMLTPKPEPKFPINTRVVNASGSSREGTVVSEEFDSYEGVSVDVTWDPTPRVPQGNTTTWPVKRLTAI